jgi:hypothetical protein
MGIEHLNTPEKAHEDDLMRASHRADMRSEVPIRMRHRGRFTEKLREREAKGVPEESLYKVSYMQTVNSTLVVT